MSDIKNIGELYKNTFSNEKVVLEEGHAGWFQLDSKLTRVNFLKFSPAKFNVYYAGLITGTFLISSAVGIDYFVLSENNQNNTPIEEIQQENNINNNKNALEQSNSTSSSEIDAKKSINNRKESNSSKSNSTNIQYEDAVNNKNATSITADEDKSNLKNAIELDKKQNIDAALTQENNNEEPEKNIDISKEQRTLSKEVPVPNKKDASASTDNNSSETEEKASGTEKKKVYVIERPSVIERDTVYQFKKVRTSKKKND